jgi:hypothetical protein
MAFSRVARPRVLALAALLLQFAVAGCGNDSSAGKDLQVANIADSFQFQVTDTKSYSHTYSYTWANSGTSATVNQSSAISGGDATLVIKDNSGTTVYTKSLKQNGTFTTTAGIAGNWTIQLLANKVSGTLNFRAQKL